MVKLQPLDSGDYERIAAWIDSRDLLVQWGGSSFSHPLTAGQLHDHFDTDEDRPARYGFKAVVDGRMVGSLELARIDREHGSGSISRVFVDPDERDRGIGASMVQQVLEFGFAEVGLHRIELRVFDCNEAAIACYESVGFVHEGVHRDSHYHDGEYWTTLQMSMLEGEWRAGNERQNADA